MQLWVPIEARSPGCGERYQRYAVLGKDRLWLEMEKIQKSREEGSLKAQR